MKQKNNLYHYLCSMGNLILAWRKARKGKTKIPEVMVFEENIEKNLLLLHSELASKTYKPLPLSTFVLRDPKTRVISKSNFRDRVIHHTLINVIGNIFEKTFIYDSCANQKKKGTSLAIQRFHTFQRKVTNNHSKPAFCFKADIKQYFPNIDHCILLNIIERKIKDKEVLWLIKQIISNTTISSVGGERTTENSDRGTLLCSKFSDKPILNQQNKINRIVYKGMPLGNLTSQFFANVYLNELDQFVKHKLKCKYYLRYVDDFVILHSSRKQLYKWKEEITKFLIENLNLELHPQKSRIMPLIRGVDFVGFRNFYKHILLRKRNIRTIQRKSQQYKSNQLIFSEFFESYKGWEAYAKWANTYKLRQGIKKEIIDVLWDKI